MSTEERDHTNCRVPTCPLLGTMSSNTTGTKDWDCFLHFGRNAAQRKAIDSQLDHWNWLAIITRKLRDRSTESWADNYRSAKQEIIVHKQPELLIQKGESVSKWLVRLEKFLSDQCTQDVPQLPSLSEKMNIKDSWEKCNFNDLVPV